MADRRNIYQHIEQHNPSAADAIDDAISRGARRLQAFPNLGHPGRLKGTFELTVHPHYILIYRIVGEELQIVRVLHTARNWPRTR